MTLHIKDGGVWKDATSDGLQVKDGGVWKESGEGHIKDGGVWKQFHQSQYLIERSLRFNSSDSAYLSKNFGSAGNRKTWTWAGWVKNCVSTNTSYPVTFLSARNASNSGVGELFWVAISNAFTGSGFQIVAGDGAINYCITTAFYRDPSSWYHVVAAYDSTQATAANRFKLYVNGLEVTQFNTDNRASITYNSDGAINRTSIPHYIGNRPGVYSNCYLADVHFIDGQALDPTSFGEFDDNGVWQPIAYTGTYGTNGFHLPFSDNSTAAALGTDTSGNSNTWTVNNISVAAGAGNDSLLDSPTNYGTDTGAGGEVRGNYCTWNPLQLGASAALANGNLDITHGAATGTTHATIGVSSGKWYWEVTHKGNTYLMIGVAKPQAATNAYLGSTSDGYGYLDVNGTKYNGSSSAYGASYTLNDIIGVALDMDAGTLTFYKNGVSQGVAFTGLSGTLFPAIGDAGGGAASICIGNFGQRPFAYTAPTGYKALCTTNLPTPTIAEGSTAMDIVLYTGNGVSGRTVSGLNLSPDLVWIKSRSSGSYVHELFDSVRGAGYRLVSNLTNAEAYNPNYLQQFNSDGFQLGSGASENALNQTYVAWTWDAGSSTVTNTQGSITSQVRANPSAGFSIVTYTGTGSAATVGHGLGISPSFIIIKNRDSARNWRCYHASLGATYYIDLNSTAAVVGPTSGAIQAVSSTTFTVPGSFELGTIEKYVAYCFAPVAGYSAFGSYTGNGSADGPFVYTGFRPRFLLVKLSSGSIDNWFIQDTARSPYNVSVNTLSPDNTNSESSGTYDSVDILSNGFKPRDINQNFNGSGFTYIYAAFAESPFQYARAR